VATAHSTGKFAKIKRMRAVFVDLHGKEMRFQRKRKQPGNTGRPSHKLRQKSGQRRIFQDKWLQRH